MFQIFENFFENHSFKILFIFILICSVFSIGDINRHLAIQDTSTSGIFSSNLLLYPEIYSQDILKNLSSNGILSPGVISNVLLFKYFDVNPIYTTYFFLIFGSFIFSFGYLYLSLSFFKKRSLAVLSTLMMLSFGIIDNNLANFGPGTSFQVFPDGNFTALGLICFFLAFVLANRIFLSFLTLCGLIFFHLGHAILLIPFYYFFLFYSIIIKKTYRVSFFKKLILFIAPIGLFLSLLISNLNISESGLSNNYIFNIIYGLKAGHIYPWEQSNYLSIILGYSVVILFFILSLKEFDKLPRNFWFVFISLFCLISLYTLIHLFVIFFKFDELIKFVQILPMRSSVYLQLFIFPLSSFFLINKLLKSRGSMTYGTFLLLIIIFSSHKSIGDFFLFTTDYFNFGNFIFFKIIFSVLSLLLLYFFYRRIRLIKKSSILLLLILSSNLTLESFNFFYGSFFANSSDKELVKLLQWMESETKSSSRFITIDHRIQMNGISNRSTFRPIPFVTEIYRSQNDTNKFFSKKVLELWSEEFGYERGWYDEKVKPRIYSKYKQLNESKIIEIAEENNCDYFITDADIELNFDISYKNEDHIIYKIKVL